ncbi:hypothetical protein [Desulfovibrio sp. SGI.169]
MLDILWMHIAVCKQKRLPVEGDKHLIQGACCNGTVAHKCETLPR